MYEVLAKCGHVGKNKYILKTFAVEADSGSLAATIVRNTPRVKHHHRDAIRQVTLIDTPRYLEIVEENEKDPYFRCHSVQEQRKLCREMCVTKEERGECERSVIEKKKRNYYDGKCKIRNMKKYMKYVKSKEDDVA